MKPRRARILELVTDAYIRSAKPVASKALATLLEVSSATVRNDFAALEEEGYLHQPHTSAGRVPTQKAYERYIRKFIPPQRLTASEQAHLSTHLSGRHGDALFQRIATVTAQLSGYAVIVRLPSEDSLYAVEIHLSALSDSRVLALAILENGLTRQVLLDLAPSPSEDTLREAERNLRQLALPLGSLAEALQDIASRSDDDLARTLSALSAAWSDMTPPRIFSDGLGNLMSEPESADPDFVKQVIVRVETPTEASEAYEKNQEVSVIVEQALALVSSRLEFGQSLGSLTVLGPNRMRYRETLSVAHGVSHIVNQGLQMYAAP